MTRACVLATGETYPLATGETYPLATGDICVLATGEIPARACVPSSWGRASLGVLGDGLRIDADAVGVEGEEGCGGVGLLVTVAVKLRVAEEVAVELRL